MGVKVAIVGAGSTYTPELVEGFIRRADRFPVDELALLDVDPSRLEVVGGLARRMLDRAGFGGRTVLTGDRDEAIDGAASGYSSLEYDAEQGGRGSRQAHVEPLLRELSARYPAPPGAPSPAAIVLAQNKPLLVSSIDEAYWRSHHFPLADYRFSS